MRLRSGGSVSSGPLPLINHSNYLPQPQECSGRAAPWPLPRWEALWGLGAPTRARLTLEKGKTTLSMKMQEINSTASSSTERFTPLPLTTLPLWFHLHFGIYQNWVSQTVCQRATFMLPGTVGQQPNLHPIQCNLGPLILLCSALAGGCTQLYKVCLPVPSWAVVVYCKVVKILYFYNVDSFSIVSP